MAAAPDVFPTLDAGCPRGNLGNAMFRRGARCRRAGRGIGMKHLVFHLLQIVGTLFGTPVSLFSTSFYAYPSLLLLLLVSYYLSHPPLLPALYVCIFVCARIFVHLSTVM